jgi:hypothetical protein
MPMTSLYVDIPPTRLKHLATCIQKWMNETSATYDHFLARYGAVKSYLDPEGIVAPMNRWRLLSFLNLARDNSAIRTARALRCGEAEIIAAVIGVSLEALLGLEYESTYRPLNILGSNSEIDSIMKIVEKFQKTTVEIISWAEILPPAVTPPSAIRRFAQLTGNKLPFEELANAWRARFSRLKRTWRCTHLMFLSDFRNFWDGERNIENLSGKVLEDYHRQTIRSLDERGFRLLIADDENNHTARALKFDMQDYCYVTTWDERLVQLIARSGTYFSSDRPRHTKYWRGMQEEFISVATYTGRELTG